MIDVLQYLASILVIAGGVFSLLSAVGMIRLPDLYTRMHAASKSGVVGAGLVLLAIVLVSLDGAVIMRALLGIIFLVLTTPVAAHLLARAAYQAGISPAPETVLNDLAAAQSRQSRSDKSA